MEQRHHRDAQCTLRISHAKELEGVSDALTGADKQDADYIRKWYTIDYDGEQAVSSLGDRDESERVKKGQTDFKPYVAALLWADGDNRG